MQKQEIQNGIDELKSALGIVDIQVSMGAHSPEGVRDLGMAVDNLRTSIWIMLKAENQDDYEGLLGRTRVRRAVETCEDILSDLYSGSLSTSTPGLEVMHATLLELSEVCEGRQR
jgi:hypothetical protein